MPPDATPVAPPPAILHLPDGRALAYAEYGAPRGRPVLVFHGVPGTRLMWRNASEPASRHGLRLIAIDRPGFGASTPQPDRKLSDWQRDVTAVVDHLGVGKFAVAGVSGGGPFAVATAAAFGERVTALGLISPMGPIASLQYQIDLHFTDRFFFLRLPHRPRLMRVFFGVGNMLFRRNPRFHYDAFVRALPRADREILRELALKKQVIEDVLESLKQGGDGARSDMMIFSRPWDVEYESITAPAVLWQGTADTIVPVPAAMRLGSMLPNCEVIRLPDAGHFWVYRNFETIMAKLRALIGQDR